MLEAHAHEPPGRARRLGDAVDVGRADAGRLLHQHVGARLQARDGQIGQAVVGHRHHKYVEVLRQQRVQRGEGQRAQRHGGRRLEVVGAHELVAVERLRALAADEAAPGEADPQALAHWYSVPEQPPNSKSNSSSGAPARAMAMRVSAGLVA